MKIIYVLNVTSLAAGATKSFLGLLNEVEKKNEVMVIVPDNGEIVSFLRNRNIDVKVLPYIFNIRPFANSFKDIVLFVPRYIKRKIFNRVSAGKLAKIAKEFGADIIHTNTSVNEIGLVAAKKIGIPHVFHVREYGDKDHGLHIYNIYKQLHSEGSYNIFITKDIASYYNCAEGENNIVIYNPVVDSNQINTPSTAKTYFLYAGRVNRTKGVLDLIKGYINYVENNPGSSLPLKIAGSISEPNQQEVKIEADELLKKANAADKVEWLGERKDVKNLMAKARAVVVPSFFEGFGRVMPESMAAGTLVIGRDTGGTHEQFENGLEMTGHDIGLRFSDIPSLATALKEASEMSEDVYKNIVEDSHKVIKTLYSLECSTVNVMKFYERIYRDSQINN